MDMFFELNQMTTGNSVGLLLDGWREEEVVVAFSPHDDDALLGCGYLLHHLLERKIPVYVVIFCNGNAGYSDITEKSYIVEKRKEETRAAYERLGVEKKNILYLDVPDFSLFSYATRIDVGGRSGTFDTLITFLRQVRATRVLIPNGYMEHQDHEAAYKCGIYDAVQSSDPILADLGEPIDLRSGLIYAVWSDFSPVDALAAHRDVTLRANSGVLTAQETEDNVIEAIKCFSSQLRIIDDLIDQRRSRKMDRGWVELYQKIVFRPKLRYELYRDCINRLL